MRDTLPTPPELPRIQGWSIDRPLAGGAQAEAFRIHRAGDPTRRPFVAKVFRFRSPNGEPYPIEQQRWRFLREVTALRSLDEAGCPGIVSVIEHHLPTDARPWYVMPFYAGGSMREPPRPDRPSRFCEPFHGRIDRVLEIAEALANTLAWMHAHTPRCVHRDVNTGNVFFAEVGGPPVLGDFGIAHLDPFPPKPEGAECLSGSWFWRPPELDRGDCYSTEPAADVFMLGGLIYESLSGGEYLPAHREWNGAFPHEAADLSLRRHTADPRIQAVDQLLRAMWRTEPERRPSAWEVASTCRTIRRGAATSGQRKRSSRPAPASPTPAPRRSARRP